VSFAAGGDFDAASMSKQIGPSPPSASGYPTIVVVLDYSGWNLIPLVELTEVGRWGS
jgi:hypothetical protein